MLLYARCFKQSTRTISVPFAAVFLVAASLALVTCGKDSTTKSSPSEPVPVYTRITITPSSVSLNSIGQTMPLTARVFDQNNTVLGSATVSWSSSDVGVATVSSQGLVTAVANGTATVTVSSGVASATVAVTVIQSASSIVLDPSSAALVSLGETVKLTASVQDENSQAVEGAAVTWSSSDEGVATVGAHGLVTAVSNGTATITARSGSASATAAVTVMQSASHIVLDPSSATLVSLGETVQLTASVQDDNGQAVEGAAVTWSSSDEGVATVSNHGLVTAVSNGAATITARSGSTLVNATITVMQVASHIVLDPSSATLMSLGETLPLAASVVDANGQTIEDAAISWSSSDEGVATVSSQGLVTAVANGNATITAKSGSISSTATITVMQTAHSIVLEPPMTTLTAIDETVQLTAAVLDRNEQPVEGATVSWTSSDPGVAAVDDEGLVTAVGNGSVGITAYYGDISAMVRIEVEIAVPDDRDVLITLYNALDGPNWTHSNNWLSDLPLGAWYGVETDGDGKVIKLDLGFNDLSGSIPPELGNLTNLQELDLRENWQLSCSIPPELGNLTSLRQIYIYTIPVFTAEFPPRWDPVPDPACSIPAELGNLADLQVLHLGLRTLSGSIPAELGNLTNLQVLDLGFNALSGSVPPELGKLANLHWLNLGYNALSGSIPPELGNLAKLRELHLPLNALSGSIPPALGNLTSLHTFDLGFNGLSGSVPPELGNLSELTYLSLVLNEDMSGPLPDTFTRLDNLESLFLFVTGLCVPPEAAFLAWLERIQAADQVEYCGAMQGGQ